MSVLIHYWLRYKEDLKVIQKRMWYKKRTVCELYFKIIVPNCEKFERNEDKKTKVML